MLTPEQLPERGRAEDAETEKMHRRQPLISTAVVSGEWSRTLKRTEAT